MKASIPLLLLFALAGFVEAQQKPAKPKQTGGAPLVIDDVINVKNIYAPYEPIIIGCICDPPTNGTLQVFWKMDDESKHEPNGAKGLHVWAPPGEHWVEVTLATQTFREMLVFVPDKDNPMDLTKAKAEKIKIQESLFIDRFEKRFTVTGQAPQPPPLPNNKVAVPNISGLTWDAALVIITSSGLKLEPGTGSVRDLIDTQVPTADTIVDRGSVVKASTKVNPLLAGPRSVLILHETGNKTNEWGNQLNLLQTGPQSKYLDSKGHQLFILDADSKGSDGKPSPVVTQWLNALGSGYVLPVVVVIDPKTKTMLHHQNVRGRPEGTMPVTSADEILTIIKNFGG